jgi:hypothetical protein
MHATLQDAPRMATRRPGRCVRRVLLGAGLALAALPAAPALAQTTIGQTGGGANITCGPQMVIADTSYVVPSGGGTITSFSFQSVAANAGQQLDFLVLRPTGGSNYTVVGKTGPVTLAGTGAVETFAANIPVQGGEILGLWHPGRLTACVRGVGTGGGLISSQAPVAVDPSVGDPVSLPGAIPVFSLNESANLVTTPTNMDQCKNGGWQSLGVFKNQGDCVSFVATGGKNPPGAEG